MARYEAGIRTEARIVDATRQLLGDQGLEGTTLKAICDKAGVRAGSFYNLFSSKDEVVLRVVKEAITAVDPHPDQTEPDSVADLVEAFIAFITKESTLARIYLQIAISGALTNDSLGKRVLRHHHRRVDRLSAALMREQPELDDQEAVARAQVILASLQGLAFNWLIDPAFDFAGHARRAVSGRLV